MRDKLKITILGSGTSTGVPIVGCPCPVCQSNDPKNKRLRPALFLETPTRKILIDSGPDIRTQLLRENITNIDALVITHDHADHTHGIDDLRVFTFRRQEAIPVYTSKKVIQSLKQRFAYIFDPTKIFGIEGPKFGAPIAKLELKEVSPFSLQAIAGLSLEFHPLPHGHIETNGIIHKNFAYLTDCVDIPSPTLENLKQRKLDLLILDCAKRQQHNSHLHLDKSIELAKYISPKRLRLTHLGHDFDYETLENELSTLPFEAKPTYDGEKFEIDI